MSADQWSCPDCPITIHLHPDPDHESQEWTRNFIAHHEATHAKQLHEDHGGDIESWRLWLRNPTLHAALKRERDRHLKGTAA